MYSQLTSRDFALHAGMLSLAIQHFGLKLNPRSDLAVMLHDLEWMGSFPEDAAQPQAGYQLDKTRALWAFVRYEQARRIAWALLSAVTIPGSDEKSRHLKKRLDRLQTQDAQSQDYLFELEIAGRLVRRGLAVAFEEPDLVTRLNDKDVALACKRPRGIRGVREAVSDGRKQVARRGIPGIILVGIEALLHRSGDPQKPTIVYDVDGPADLHRMAAEALDDVETMTQQEVREASDAGVEGILFCGITTALSKEPSAYIYEWVHRPVTTSSSTGLVQTLDSLLFASSALA